MGGELMKRPGWLITAVAILLFWNNSNGQIGPGRWGLGFYGGFLKLVGDDVDYSLVNTTGGFALTHIFSTHLVGEFDFDMGWVRPRDDDSQYQVRPNAPYRTYIHPMNLGLRILLLPSYRFCPYLTPGAGITHWNLRDISGEDTWFPIPQSGSSISGNQVNFTLFINAGVLLRITNGLAIDAQFRYGQLLGQDKDNIGIGDVNNGLVQLRVGLLFLMGDGRDRDKDGIEDIRDGDPYQAEDFDGFEDYDGIPDRDNDRDGIPDELDEAPDLPEDRDGFQDDDGIPDLDNDRDGIPDSKDECPDMAEDLDSFQDQDGCPDWDNDNDTIPDSLDQCPNEPENFNNYQDEDGCPDKKPAPPELKQGQALILPDVTFESGSAELTLEALQALELIWEYMRDNPDVEMEIRGYTDSLGDASSNLNLSQRRADAVKFYLAQRGVAFRRLRAIGFGEANPIASNQTPEGRLKNRRIEFIQIENQK
jgi:outer membrane protein OmpA-like peptidoglycan-associated protein